MMNRLFVLSKIERAWEAGDYAIPLQPHNDSSALSIRNDLILPMRPGVQVRGEEGISFRGATWQRVKTGGLFDGRSFIGNVLITLRSREIPSVLKADVRLILVLNIIKGVEPWRPNHKIVVNFGDYLVSPRLRNMCTLLEKGLVT